MMTTDPYSGGDSHWQSRKPERLPAHQAAGGPAAVTGGTRSGEKPLQQPAHDPAAVTPRRPAQCAPQGGILQRQLMRLIGEILGDEGLRSDLRLSLLRHISEHRGHPEQAMLAHLHEIQDKG
ncbi:hypothetical protein [Arthrobacter globiformis]|uniref:hypothetical protein n=1 Tax=Arthrobacter globiformis TaxID=1665 RepID=UPI002793CD8F|nr:hypothetical protein [Arthrobacter globiformis]MDQ0620009.1 hypothetical protein [Arthrobacter globiformis]